MNGMVGRKTSMSDNAQKPLPPLTGAQIAAVEPDRDVWLSASAGSGKTQVLSARVIRLLLEPGVHPENLLCLTFTKAAAAEMADRINHRLAYWVQAKGGDLAADLEAIGADISPQGQARARKLFAQVLDAPGGGLQIMTIHSFCQSLLSAFPEEAGLLPGFEPIDDREVAELHSDALSELVQAADRDGRGWLITNLQNLSLLLGEDGVRQYLRRCVAQGDALEQLVPDDKGALALARRIMGLDFEGSAAEELARRCEDAAIDRQMLHSLAEMNAAWGVKTGFERTYIISDWLLMDPVMRAAELGSLRKCWTTQSGTPAKKGPKNDEAFWELMLDAHHWTEALVQFRNTAEYAERLAPALVTGKAYAAQYRELKHARGLVDFDDLIARAADLLSKGGMAEWVRYKLDRKIDHILIDEAQDTNEAQWKIVEALSDDFYSGAGAGAERPRTVFAVGDFKQAIYGFQGTAPEKYREAGERLDRRIADNGATLHRLSLSQSFRSTKPVLRFVNAVIDELGFEQLGLEESIPAHGSNKADFGTIELMRPVTSNVDDDSEEEADTDDAEEQWVTSEKLELADRLARHVKNLIDAKPVLATTGLPLEPGDIMILLRSRGELAALIVARLHSLGVPVAGIDRLKIVEPIAVQDMLATIRFALQPQDDLSLACLLVSPLIGWDQDQLLKHAYRPSSEGLWQHLRSQPEIAADLEPLRKILKSADLTTPYAFLENILSGPISGRRKLQSRLGSEILVPVEELLNLAMQYQQEGGASLQGFLEWFERGGGEIKREGLAQSRDVRVMTVHGAKGLEAPVVILADIAADPEKAGDWNRGIDIPMDGDAHLPLLPVKKSERGERLDEIAERAKERDRQEHFRLLYVAMTRAAEHLVLAGSLGTRSKGETPENSWYNALEAGMKALGCDWHSDPLWGATMRYSADGAFKRQKPQDIVVDVVQQTPDWLLVTAPAEEIPPRPLAPSNLDDDLYGDAPASALLKIAALRGKLLHALFEQYAGGDIETFQQAALDWLARNNPDHDFNHKAAIGEVVTVMQHPDWAELFSAAARAEVPLAALVGTAVITGRVDRLLVEDDRVRLIDFKTGRNVPQHSGAVSTPILRQMAHYVAALESIFAPRKVEAALLYTNGPAMIELSAEVLAPHKPI
jgi:ATP-dependent helicase/nuclease subunit A